ncbi:hypothetical protein BDD12DRAFT_857061 [Trichophaea hybrida]|nr:hypothetical protein BDD12DRAFT_857061 [Trichophaea hybrida]
MYLTECEPRRSCHVKVTAHSVVSLFQLELSKPNTQPGTTTHQNPSQPGYQSYSQLCSPMLGYYKEGRARC